MSFKLTIDLSSPSHTYTCELDYASMEPTGQIQCDYSRFKETRVIRLFDMQRSIFIYVAISRKPVDGSPANSTDYAVECKLGVLFGMILYTEVS